MSLFPVFVMSDLTSSVRLSVPAFWCDPIKLGRVGGGGGVSASTPGTLRTRLNGTVPAETDAEAAKLLTTWSRA
jgi:hypothetical protein